MGMEWPSMSWGWPQATPCMVGQAKEELQILETQHPNRYEYLKLELKSLISSLESQNRAFNVHDNALHCMPTSSSPATTQASSTTKKRKKGSCDVEKVKKVNVETSKNKVQKVDSDGEIRKRRRIDVVIQRAQACLRKIQLFKTSFC